MILVCAAVDFHFFGKFRKLSIFKNSLKICHKQNVKCLVFFQVDLAGLQSPVLKFDKNCTLNAYFPQKVDYYIFEPKDCEETENSSKKPLIFSPLQCT